MPSTAYTPLRYPGGKAKLGGYLAEVMRVNRFVDGVYAEPYAGGAGAGLHLLFRGYASRLHLNDIDRGVISFWRAAVAQSEMFAARIERVALSVREWDCQREVLQSAPMGFDLGFAFFYLNRTNRSGIMNAGVIGGREQRGNYAMDARFNRKDLAERIRALGGFRKQISITRLDALEFLKSLPVSPKLLTYLDPPYYHKGQQLYTNFYNHNDHVRIAEQLHSYENRWLMTYDACDEIRAMYQTRRVIESELSYSAREVRRGKEVVIYGPGLRMPAPAVAPNRAVRWRAGFELV